MAGARAPATSKVSLGERKVPPYVDVAKNRKMSRQRNTRRKSRRRRSRSRSRRWRNRRRSRSRRCRRRRRRNRRRRREEVASIGVVAPLGG